MVTVPRAGVVYAVGAVTHPGGFVMGNDRQQMTVLKLLVAFRGPYAHSEVQPTP